jgi:hypothetical protein
MQGNFISECGQIQGSLKLLMAIMVILSQALYPGREGAETGCRLKNQETEHVINI